MRVLTMIHSYEPGGVERVALRLVRQWRADGIDAPLYVGRPDGAMADAEGAGLAAIVADQPPPLVAAYETLWMMLTLPGVIRRLRPDILFCPGNSYTVIGVVMRLVLGRACPPVVAKVSNDLDRRDMPWPLRPLYRLWLRIQGRLFDHVVAIEPSMKPGIARLMRMPASRVSAIANPLLSRDQIERLGGARARSSGRGRSFVAIGRLVAQKNLPLMLRAFASAATPADRLTLIGEGPLRAALERQCHRLGIADRVHFTGHVAEAADRLPAHDVLLLSSDYEGVPGVIAEALAAGLPIIATRCSDALPALLDGGRLGTLVAIGDEAALARALAAARPGTQDRAASLAQARRFAIAPAARGYIGLFARLARARRGAPLTSALPDMR
jgi:glycosyltransferase involved in cell wall biosynthesis